MLAFGIFQFYCENIAEFESIFFSLKLIETIFLTNMFKGFRAFFPQIIGAWQSKNIIIKFLWFLYKKLFSCLLHFIFKMFGWQNDEKMNENFFKQQKCGCAFEMRKLLSENLQFVIISNKLIFIKDWMNDLQYLTTFYLCFNKKRDFYSSSNPYSNRNPSYP